MKLPRGRTPQTVQGLPAYFEKVAGINSVTVEKAKQFCVATLPSIAKLVVESEAPKHAEPPKPVKVETEEEKIARIAGMFDHMLTLIRMAAAARARAAIVSGAGGVGKTYSIKRVLENYKETQEAKGKSFKFAVKSGIVSPQHLFKLLWDYQEEGNVVVLDDADNILFNADGLAILKAALDSEKVREVSYMRNSPLLKEHEIPTTFQYRGTMIFITNVDFQRYIETSRSDSIVPHLQALLTRAHYLDLGLHQGDPDLWTWVKYVVTKHHVLVQDGLDHKQEKEVVAWMEENVHKLRNLSIRTAKKVGEAVLMNPQNWKPLAAETEFRK